MLCISDVHQKVRCSHAVFSDVNTCFRFRVFMFFVGLIYLCMQSSPSPLFLPQFHDDQEGLPLSLSCPPRALFAWRSTILTCRHSWPSQLRRSCHSRSGFPSTSLLFHRTKRPQSPTDPSTATSHKYFSGPTSATSCPLHPFQGPGATFDNRRILT